nr:diguanylate cyclase [Kineococcus siccus]
MDRTFEYALTYRRETVLAAAQCLVLRVVPDEPSSLDEAAGAAPATAGPARLGPAPTTGDPLLHRAVRAAASGITISDVRREGHPIVFANQAFAELAGTPVEQLLGRSARHLDGEGTDRAAVERLRAAVADGRPGHEILLQHRGPQREPFWCEVRASPVVDDDGRVVQCVAVYTEAERGTAPSGPRERVPHRAALTRIEELSRTDPLTGLLNHHRFSELAERELAAATGSGTALLSLGIDGFRAVDDELGHAAGDLLLVSASRRLLSRLRRSDLAARLGGDEFLVALVDLDRAGARGEALRVADDLGAALSAPYRIGGRAVRVSVSIGVSSRPGDDGDLRRLLTLAASRMLERKQGPGGAPAPAARPRVDEVLPRH